MSNEKKSKKRSSNTPPPPPTAAKQAKKLPLTEKAEAEIKMGIVEQVSNFVWEFNKTAFIDAKAASDVYEVKTNLVELEQRLEVVRQVVHGLVYTGLTSRKFSENKDQVEAAQESYAFVKHTIQNAVADAFESAFVQYSGQEAGFYCKVIPAGPAVNNLEI